MTDPSPCLAALDAALHRSARALGRPRAVPASDSTLLGFRADQVVWTTNVEHGAWCTTLLGTFPRTYRRTELIPLLPMTTKSSLEPLGEVENRLGCIARDRVRFSFHSCLAGTRQDVVEHCLNLAVRENRPGELRRQGPGLERVRVVGTHDVERRVECLRQLDRLPDRDRSGLRAIGSHDDWAAHAHKRYLSGEVT